MITAKRTLLVVVIAVGFALAINYCRRSPTDLSRISTHQVHVGWVNGVAISKQGTIAFSIGNDRRVCVTDIENGLSHEFNTANGLLPKCVAISPSEAQIAIGTADGSVALLDTSARTQLKCAKIHKSEVMCLTFDHDKKILVSVSLCGEIGILHPSNCHVEHSIRSNCDVAIHVAISPDSKRVACSGMDYKAAGVCDIWDISEVRLIHTFKEKRPVNCASFSPCGRYLALASDDLIVIEATSGNELKRLKVGDCKLASSIWLDAKRILVAAKYYDRIWSELIVYDFDADSVVEKYRVEDSLCLAFNQKNSIAIIGTYCGEIMVHRMR